MRQTVGDDFASDTRMEFLKDCKRYWIVFFVVGCHLSVSSAAPDCKIVTSEPSSQEILQALQEMRSEMNPKPPPSYMEAVAKAAEGNVEVQRELLKLAAYGRMEPDDVMLRLDSIHDGYLSKTQFVEYGALRTFKRDFLGLLSGNKQQQMWARTSYHHVPEAEIEFAKTNAELNTRFQAAEALIDGSQFQITTLGRRFLMDSPPLIPKEMLKALDYKPTHDEAIVMGLEMTLPDKTKRHFALRMNYRLEEKGLQRIRDLEVIELSMPATLSDGFYTNRAPSQPIFRIKEPTADLYFDEVIVAEVAKDSNDEQGEPTKIKVRFLKDHRQIHEDLHVIPRTGKNNRDYSFSALNRKGLLSRQNLILIWNTWSQQLSVATVSTVGVGRFSVVKQPKIYPFVPVK